MTSFNLNQKLQIFIIFTVCIFAYGDLKFFEFENITVFHNAQEQSDQILRFLVNVNTITFVRFINFIGEHNDTLPLIFRMKKRYIADHTFITIRLFTSRINCVIAQRVKPLPNLGLVLHLGDLDMLRTAFEANCLIRSGFGGVLLVFREHIGEYSFNELEMIMKEFWQLYGKRIARIGFIFCVEIWVYHPFIVRGENLSDPNSFGGLLKIDDPTAHFETMLYNLNGFPVKVEQFPSVGSMEIYSPMNRSNRDRLSYVGVDPEIERALQSHVNYTGWIFAAVSNL